MYNLIRFFVRYKNTLIFLVLFGFSFFLMLQAHSYQRSKFLSSTNFIVGEISQKRADITAYFGLKKENEKLVKENIRLRRILWNDTVPKIKDTSKFQVKGLTELKHYTILDAYVIANRYRGIDNYLLLNKGKKEGITSEMGVITENGVVGIVEGVSKNYTRVISILNSNLSINAQLKNSNHFGTLKWEGRDPELMELIDIPTQAEIRKGDTVITNGRSLIFPKGIPLGTIKSFEKDRLSNSYHIEVKLFDDMTNLGNVYVIRNNDKREVDSLLEKGHE